MNALLIVPEPVLELTPKDRCDASASGSCRALVRLISGSGTSLQMCASHYRRCEPGLLGAGWTVVADSRDGVLGMSS